LRVVDLKVGWLALLRALLVFASLFEWQDHRAFRQFLQRLWGTLDLLGRFFGHLLEWGPMFFAEKPLLGGTTGALQMKVRLHPVLGVERVVACRANE